MGTWDMIRDERASFADALTTLTPEAWNAPSLLPGWSVRDVVAHMIATGQSSPPKFLAGILASGLRFDTMSARNIERVKAGRSDADLVAAYRSTVGSRSAPPGPSMSWLGEVIVHGEDVFRSLGPYREHPVEHVIAVADFYRGSNMLIGAKKRIDGVTLRATDTEWSYGSGPEASGPAIALVLAMTGRSVAVDDLTGPGVEVLRTRS
jgi:uncharacterized protein (TIGR03083 family)